MTTPTPTPEPFANATNATSTFASGIELLPFTLLVAIAAVMLLAATQIAPWLAQSRAFKRVFGGVAASIVYAIKGVVSLLAVGVVAAPIYAISQMPAGTRDIALRYIGYAIAGYIALVVLGWLADRAVTAFIEAHPEYDEWGDIFPDTPDETDLKDADPGVTDD